MHESLPNHYVISETKSRRGNVSVVRARLILAGKECSVLTKHVEHRPHKHEITIIGGDRRGSHIVETYEPFGDTTRLTITADIKRYKFFDLHVGISTKQLESWLEGIIDAIENAART